MIIDPIYFHLTRLQYVKQKQNIFRVRLTHYKGYPIQLKDGTCINKNDLLIKIHFHNVKLLRELYKAKDEFQKAVLLYKMVKDSLPELARYIQNHSKSKEIKGIIGITSIKIGSNRLGFEIYTIKNRFYRKLKWLAFYPIYFLSSGINHNKKKHADPLYFFMSKDYLIQRYLPLVAVKPEDIKSLNLLSFKMEGHR